VSVREKHSRKAEVILEGFTSVTTSLLATQLLDISNKLDTLIRKTIEPAELRMLLDEIKQTLATGRAWSNDTVVGMAEPRDGMAGSNLITVGEGKDVDYDVSNKYLASIIFELESFEVGDYVKEVRITNGTDVKVIVKNMSLAFSNKEVEFLSPPYIPQGYWLEVELNLATAKKYSIALEIVY